MLQRNNVTLQSTAVGELRETELLEHIITSADKDSGWTLIQNIHLLSKHGFAELRRHLMLRARTEGNFVNDISWYMNSVTTKIDDFIF